MNQVAIFRIQDDIGLNKYLLNSFTLNLTKEIVPLTFQIGRKYITGFMSKNVYDGLSRNDEEIFLEIKPILTSIVQQDTLDNFRGTYKLSFGTIEVFTDR